MAILQDQENFTCIDNKNFDFAIPFSFQRKGIELANSRAEPQIAAGREPQAMGLDLWSNVTL
jgi:hypothetical protein